MSSIRIQWTWNGNEVSEQNITFFHHIFDQNNIVIRLECFNVWCQSPQIFSICNKQCWINMKWSILSRVKTNGNVVSGKPSLKLTYHFNCHLLPKCIIFIAIHCPSVPCHCHILPLPVMPYWQILPLPAMPCLQQEQVCYQHLLLSPLPPHIILHQQTAGGSKQSVRRPTAFYRC